MSRLGDVCLVESHERSPAPRRLIGDHCRPMDDRRPPATSDAPEALVERALAGEEAAFARIVRKHREAMVRVALLVTGDVPGADEAVAAAWPPAWNRLARLREPARLEAWLCGIAAEEARRLVRARARVAEARAAAATPDGEARGDRPAAGDAGSDRPGAAAAFSDLPTAAADPALATWLVGLPPGDRTLLALRHVAGLTPDELGRATGLDPDAALERCRELAGQAASGPGSDRPADPEAPLGERLRALVDVPVAPVNIDAVARGANVTRNDHRYRVISLAIAIIVAVVVIAIPYLGERRTLPLPLPGVPTTSPLPVTTPPTPTPGTPSPSATPDG